MSNQHISIDLPSLQSFKLGGYALAAYDNKASYLRMKSIW